MLDGGDSTLLTSRDSSISGRWKEQESSGRELFVDKLRYFINNRATMSTEEIHSIQRQLIVDADVLQSRAEKSDMVFRMVDSFNRNTIHATVTWNLKNNSLCKRLGDG
jgi:singapore isolate B (sub-type 7) whole genome shotgun sequence assembly, scaffold_0